MLYILCVRLTIKVKVGIPESFKVRWYHQKITGSSHLKRGSLLIKIYEVAAVGTPSKRLLISQAV